MKASSTKINNNINNMSQLEGTHLRTKIILMVTFDVFLPIVPELFVDITSTGISTERQNYSLMCDINGVEFLKLSYIEYQWEKDGNNYSGSPTLDFSPLTLNDSGTYTCTVTITSPLLNNTHDVMNMTILEVISKLDISCISNQCSVMFYRGAAFHAK